jgi:uncharacterized sulfatase
MLPHAPHTPPKELLEKYSKVAPTNAVARYWACVEWFDRSCGEVLAEVEKRGARENTIVVYVTDNGWIQDPQTPNRFAPLSKMTPYEGGIRTPIMISWPGTLKPRRDSEHLACTIDVWPTLAALMKRPVPTDLPGVNLADEAAAGKTRPIFGEQYTHDVLDVANPTRSMEHRWVIEGNWKLIDPNPLKGENGKLPELYQLRDDPDEKVNRSAEEPAKVAALMQVLAQQWKPPGGLSQP